MSFWDKVRGGAKAAGDATKVAAHKTKLRTDMMMIDRDIQNRKKAFGVIMYDHVSPLSQTQDFYAATDDLTTILRPPVINAQKEIQALAAKRVKLKEMLASAVAKRAGAFPTKAETFGQKAMNFGKVSVMYSGETKIKTELAVVDRQIKGHKQNFGLELFETLKDAEDTRGYLPTDRQVRNIYDTCRGDIQRSETKKNHKAEELASLGGGSAAEFEGDQSNAHALTGDLSVQSSYTAPIEPSSGYTDQSSSGLTNSPDSNQQMEDLLL
jgi:hypothetical protein